MLDGFLGSTGTGMSKISFSQAGQVRSFIALCALAALFALSTAAVAQAEPPKLVPYGLFSAHEPAAVGVAVEGSGDLFVSGFVSLSGSSAFSPESVVKFDPSGKLLSPPSPFGSGYYSGVAVSPTNGDVYVLGQEGFSPPAKIFVYDPKDPCGEKHSPCLHLIEYSLEGRQLADVGAGEFGEASGGNEGRFFSMVTVNEASGRVYVTDGSRETVWMFGPPRAPVVDRELTAEVGASEAKLGALVSPGAIQTSYRFEYGTTTEYGSSTPFPEGSVGEGVQSRAVWASANGLAPGTADSIGRRNNTRLRGVAMSRKRRRADRAGRARMYSPGRPPGWRREHRQRFWAAIARGASSEDAAIEAGVSVAVGVRWFREGGGMPSITQAAERAMSRWPSTPRRATSTRTISPPWPSGTRAR
jgi:hypothetical protein